MNKIFVENPIYESQIEKKNSGRKIQTITRKQQQILISKRSDLLNVKTCLF